MGYDPNQFRDLILRVLGHVDPDLASDSAVNLLMLTAAAETGLGRYLRQMGGGPALGAFQVEPATFRDIQRRRHQTYPILDVDESHLEWDLRLSIVVARLKYRDDPLPLPRRDDLTGLAKYHVRVYNGGGKATVDHGIEAWARHVGPPP